MSVREASGVSLCKKHFGVEAVHVVDPTLLLDRDDYCNLFEGKDIKPHQNGLLVYLLDQREENEKMISYFANTLGLPPFSVNSKYETPGFHPVEECIQPSVETWLKGFYDANFVLTDSFHACVFSIIFNKPFAVFGNAKRGLSRIESLLSSYRLTDRIVYSTKDCEKLDGVIDWNNANKSVAENREHSLRFLKDSLGK